MTRKSINPKTGQPYKVLWFGDLVAPSGFGRIGNEVTRRLKTRGYDVQGIGLNYTGWPHDFPFWVYPAGADPWNLLAAVVSQWKPDILVSCQDFPFHHNIWYGCKIDFSRIRWVWITPIDGTPIHPEWAKLANFADGKMVISRFGVEAMRQAGHRVSLCHPGIDTTEFYPPTADERRELLEKAKLAGAYVVGVVCMNQGRKAISPMVAAFHEFARDKPEARLFLDMDKIGAGGWDLPALTKQMGWTSEEQARVTYCEDLFALDFAAFSPLRNRYALMNAHMVISHREGFGLPLLESMACGVPTLALDWCSGTEIVGEGRGRLVKRIDYMEHGTWGGARDAFPDMKDLVQHLQWLYDHQEAGGETGRAWAVEQTWDVTADQVEEVLRAALTREKEEPSSHEPASGTAAAISPGYSDIHGPGADIIRGHSVIQPVGQADQAAKEPGKNGAEYGADIRVAEQRDAAGNPGAG